jgi:ATP-dependent DNA helicase RecG
LFVEQESPHALERLRFFEKNNDGFKLAEKDLEMRGPGEVYGVAQSGFMNLRLAKLTDKEIIKKARESARLVAGSLEKYPTLKKKMEEWEKSVHLE